jgi:uncharacterized protein YegP (UPF0339 family)
LEDINMAKFQIYTDAKGEYRWRFRANNNKIVADSAEGYVNKSDCKDGIEIVKNQAATATLDDETAVAAKRY